MKCYKRYLSLLACLVLLLTLFSPVANAEEISVPLYHVYVQPRVENASTGAVIKTFTPFTFTPHNGVKETYYEETTTTVAKQRFRQIFTIATDNKTAFVSGDNTAKITIENISFAGGGTTHQFNIDTFNIYAYYIDGSSANVTDKTITKKTSEFYNVTFKVDATKDIDKIVIETVSNLTYTSSSPYEPFLYYGENEGDGIEFNVKIDIEDKKVGLLQGIGDKLSSGFNGMLEKLTSGFSDLKNGLSNVVNGIVELPNKLWTLISDGLKNLFVPSENFMVQYKDDWDMLLGEKLGAVYEVSQIIFGAWDDVQNADETNQIDIPIVSIPLPDNQEFTFGGYQVKIVPDGFSVLVEAVKLAIGIGCTFMFVNGLRKRYDEVMGVEK